MIAIIFCKGNTFIWYYQIFPDYVKEIRQIMEYVQLEGIHIHEDGYAKFIELTLLLLSDKTNNVVINGYTQKKTTKR